MRPLLTPAQMAAADAATIAAGTPQGVLMERAGRAVRDGVVRNFAVRPVCVLAGPGNNGGDGRIAARLLAEACWPVEVFGLDALEAAVFTPETLVLDALFGTGLARPLSGPVRSALQRARAAGSAVLAVDIPSGVDGATGAADPGTLPAERTVTFAAKKLGHVLHPGSALCGAVEVANIGIPTPHAAARENGPDLWALPSPAPGGHKYDRGYVVIFGGAQMTGAARLAAAASARSGAGLVSVVSAPRAAQVYRTTLPPHILYETLGDDPAVHIADARRNVCLIGPGAGDMARCALPLLATGKPAVLDADALTYCENEPERFLCALHPACVLTPHEGEARRLFGPLPGSKVEQAQGAADRAGCVVLLKGPDTTIAAPGQTPVVNTTGTPHLATAGSGDVLAGVIAGLMAQGMDPFHTACAGAFLHGRAGQALGPGLVAPDLIDALPLAVLS